MSDETPKCAKLCFHLRGPLTGGDRPLTEDKVWGTCEEIELTAGTLPNVVPFRVPVHEFNKFQNEEEVLDFDRWGDIELYLNDPETPDVSLKYWSIEHVEDTTVGTLQGDETPSVVEKTLYLIDRRWEFLYGKGGHCYWGKINTIAPDGKSFVDDAHKLSYKSLVTYMAGLLQYASGVSKSVTVHFTDNSLGSTYPRDLVYDGVSVPAALGTLLDDCQAVFLLKTDGTYRIHDIGSDGIPSMGSAVEIPSDENNVRNNTAKVVVITSAPSRAVVQRVITGPGDGSVDCWQYVGLETDWSLKTFGDNNTGDLSYTGAKSPKDLVRERFASLSGQAKNLAVSSLYTYLQMAGPNLQFRLPILSRGTYTVVDEATGLDRASSVRVQAKIAQFDGQVWNNSTEFVDITGFWVHPAAGLICLPSRLGKVVAPSVADYDSNFLPLSDGDLKITFCHEQWQPTPTVGTDGKPTSTSSHPYQAYWNTVFALDADGGLLIEGMEGCPTIEDALSTDAEEVVVIRMPELVSMLDGSTGTLAPLNDAELFEQASIVAARILQPNRTVKTYRYVGFHDVNPNGRIPSVRWNLRDLTTSFDFDTYFVSKNRYVEKKQLFDFAQEAKEAKVSAETAGQQAQNGTRDFATPFSVGTPQAAPPAPPTSSVFLAKVLSASGSGMYSVMEQSMTGANAYANKSGASAITAVNLSEQPGIGSGSGSGVDVGSFVWVMPLSDTGGTTRYTFERSVYAKYL